MLDEIMYEMERACEQSNPNLNGELRSIEAITSVNNDQSICTQVPNHD